MTAEVAPHEWVRDQRLDRGLLQVDVEEQTAALGFRVSQSHLSKIEKGRSPLAGLGAEKLDALRRVLGVSPGEWLRGTGLSIVRNVSDEAATPEPRPLPDGLQAAVDVYGKRFSDLLDPVWQQYMARFRWRTGQPDDAESWLDLYRDLSRAGIVPGES